LFGGFVWGVCLGFLWGRCLEVGRRAVPVMPASLVGGFAWGFLAGGRVNRGLIWGGLRDALSSRTGTNLNPQSPQT
jgi:hypothetical protein